MDGALIKPKPQIKKIFLDTETTGVDTRLDEIHQISGCIEIDDKIVEYFDIKMRPSASTIVSQTALDTCHVTLEQLLDYDNSQFEGYIQFKQILEQYVDKFDAHDKLHIIGYNVKFDTEMIYNWFKREGNPYFYGLCWGSAIDVMSLAAEQLIRVRSNMDDFKLVTVCKEVAIKVDEERLHEAQYDIELTRLLYRVLTKRVWFNTRLQQYVENDFEVEPAKNWERGPFITSEASPEEEKDFAEFEANGSIVKAEWEMTPLERVEHRQLGIDALEEIKKVELSNAIVNKTNTKVLVDLEQNFRNYCAGSCENIDADAVIEAMKTGSDYNEIKARNTLEAVANGYINTNVSQPAKSISTCLEPLEASSEPVSDEIDVFSTKGEKYPFTLTDEQCLSSFELIEKVKSRLGISDEIEKLKKMAEACSDGNYIAHIDECEPATIEDIADNFLVKKFGIWPELTQPGFKPVDEVEAHGTITISLEQKAAIIDQLIEKRKAYRTEQWQNFQSNYDMSRKAVKKEQPGILAHFDASIESGFILAVGEELSDEELREECEKQFVANHIVEFGTIPIVVGEENWVKNEIKSVETDMLDAMAVDSNRFGNVVKCPVQTIPNNLPEIAFKDRFKDTGVFPNVTRLEMGKIEASGLCGEFDKPFQTDLEETAVNDANVIFPIAVKIDNPVYVVPQNNIGGHELKLNPLASAFMQPQINLEPSPIVEDVPKWVASAKVNHPKFDQKSLEDAFLNGGEIKVAQELIDGMIKNGRNESVAHIHPEANLPINLQVKDFSFTLNFGKHRGKDIEYILQNDPKYIQWLSENNIKNMTFSKDILRIMQLNIESLPKYTGGNNASQRGDRNPFRLDPNLRCEDDLPF